VKYRVRIIHCVSVIAVVEAMSLYCYIIIWIVARLHMRDAVILLDNSPVDLSDWLW
jgi:hypothetical protein